MPNGAHLNRWGVAVMGTVLMICLGTVYAWSYFQNLLVQEYGWSNSQVAWVFALAIFFLGAAAAWGGPRLSRIGPRRAALTGALLFSAGYAVASLALALRSLPLLYLGYGAIGGIGLGLGYVTPVATVTKWFPDRKGLATGMVIMGFGLGALLMSKILAPLLMALTGGNLVLVFLFIGVFFLILSVGSAAFIRDPSPEQRLEGGERKPRADLYRGVLSARFGLMWLMFFCNITAGIAIISFQSPLFQDLWRAADATISAPILASYGATLIAASSLFNGAGRFFWGAVSDRIGRVWTFRIMMGSEILAFAVLALTGNPWAFGILVCWVLLCYGGGFGTMPSFVADVFGPAAMPTVYGAILTAWACAGIVGPQIVAFIKDRYAQPASAYSFLVGGGFLLLGFGLSWFLSDRPWGRAPEGAPGPAPGP